MTRVDRRARPADSAGMRIGLARRGYSATGGAERYLLRFASGLAAHGHEPVLVATADWPEAAWPHGARILVRNGRTPGDFARGVRDLRPRAPIDFLFSLERLWECDAYRAGDGVHAAWLDRRAAAGPRWRGTFRRLQPKHRQILALEASLFGGGARSIIVNSRMVGDEIRARHPSAAGRIHLVHNGYDLPAPEAGVDPGQTRAATRRSLGVGEADLLVLFTGSGWERKGLPTAVDALRLLANPALHLVVAGRGKGQRKLEGPQVHFPGATSDLAALYEAADFFILPTLYDPFSNACLEAAAHGLPVITTTANGFADCLEPGRHGELVAPGDPRALADALAAWCAPGRAAAARDECRRNVAGLTVAANVEATLAALGL